MQNLSLAFLAAASMLFISSCCPPCGGWQCGSSFGSPSNFNSARLYLPPACGCKGKGLELEFVCTSEGLRLYLNVFGLEIPPADCDSNYSFVYVSLEEDEGSEFMAERFTGGQRLLLPTEAQDVIIEALEDGQEVSITAGRYQAKIKCDQFLKLFNQMAAHCGC